MGIIIKSEMCKNFLYYLHLQYNFKLFCLIKSIKNNLIWYFGNNNNCNVFNLTWYETSICKLMFLQCTLCISVLIDLFGQKDIVLILFVYLEYFLQKNIKNTLKTKLEKYLYFEVWWKINRYHIINNVMLGKK